jgi:hypothetical protein
MLKFNSMRFIYELLMMRSRLAGFGVGAHRLRGESARKRCG